MQAGWSILIGALVLLVAACGGSADDPDVDSPSPPISVAVGESQNPDCTPDDVDGLPLSTPDRRIEDIIEVMTGERQTGDLDPVEETITDPNFGGVYGDFQGGIVVAVLDCSRIDANQLARIAGGAGYLHIVEVPYTFKQVDGFRDALVAELAANNIRGDVPIESTLTGRHIEVRVLDADQLPDGFAADVPPDVFTVVETDELFHEQ